MKPSALVRHAACRRQTAPRIPMVRSGVCEVSGSAAVWWQDGAAYLRQWHQSLYPGHMREFASVLVRSPLALPIGGAFYCLRHSCFAVRDDLS